MTIIACVIALVCPAPSNALVPIPVVLEPPARGGRAVTIRGGEATPETNVELGQRLAAKRGWVGRQWDCLYALWNRESGWQTSDPNPTSGADGIPQALPPSKMGAGWQGNAALQIRWGFGYVVGRYGDPCSALAHSDAQGWY